MIRDLFALLAKLFRGPVSPDDGWARLNGARDQWEAQLQTRIEKLEKEVVELTAALERERIEHADCRRRLGELELKVDSMLRNQDGGS